MSGDGTSDAFGILDNLPIIPGPPGATGARGIQGIPGIGQDGQDGDMGPPGPAGAPGPAGSVGATGSIGPPGFDGMDGNDIDFMWPPGGSSGSSLPAFTNTRVLFGDGSSTPVTDADLAFDTSTNQLSSGTFKAATTIGVGAATPSTSGAGITFPATQSASTDANTLDDYEEGSWTPGLAFGGASVGITYSSQVGRYVKVGRSVFVCGSWILTNKGSSTGNAAITGLPFTTNANASSCMFMNRTGNLTTITGLTGSVPVSGTTVDLADYTGTVANNTHFNNNTFTDGMLCNYSSA